MNDSVASTAPKQRKRRVTNFPVLPFSDPLALAKALFEHGSGQPVRRLTLFDAIGKAPESGPSRTLIASANKYGLIKGSAAAEHLELTTEGRKAVDETFSSREVANARVKCAIQGVPPFNGLYERYKNSKLPSKSVLIDSVKEFEVEEENAEQAVDLFIENIGIVGLLKTLSGAERIITVEHLIDGLPSEPKAHTIVADRPVRQGSLITGEHAEFELTAFYVTPIGAEGSEERKHSDLFLSMLVEPALEQFQLKVVRADAIDKPGVITRQVLEYLMKARLVVADLSFHNPNVFYELAIRHMARKPVVQLMRKADRIPFDVNQVRTIIIDNTDIYSFAPKIEFYRSEIANQVRRAIDDPESVDSPVAWYQMNSDKTSN